MLYKHGLMLPLALFEVFLRFWHYR
jgi:hypothetical protein